MAVLVGVAAFYFWLQQTSQSRVFQYFPPLVRIFATPLILRNEALLPATPEIARQRGGLLRQLYRPSHSTDLAYALIAATARALQATLVTFNRHQFPLSDKIEVPYPRD